MADSLQDLLHQKDFEKPNEIEQIKNYIRKKYKDGCSVSLNKNALVITVGNSSLAATLRMDLLNIKKKFQIEQKVVIRTS